MIGPMPDANAVRYFQDKLAYQTSPREVVAAQKAGDKMTVVDVRRAEAFAKGHIPGSVNLVLNQLSDARGKLDPNHTIVVYDWGPASTESARAALALAAQGYRVRSMLGGFEYWSRLGLGIEGPDGTVKRRAPDPYITTADAGWD